MESFHQENDDDNSMLHEENKNDNSYILRLGLKVDTFLEVYEYALNSSYFLQYR